jgi:hypothetical protein
MAVFTLTIGIGANSSIVGIIERLVLHPPFPRKSQAVASSLPAPAILKSWLSL